MKKYKLTLKQFKNKNRNLNAKIFLPLQNLFLGTGQFDVDKYYFRGILLFYPPPSYKAPPHKFGKWE